MEMLKENRDREELPCREKGLEESRKDGGKIGLRACLRNTHFSFFPFATVKCVDETPPADINSLSLTTFFAASSFFFYLPLHIILPPLRQP